LARYAGIDGVVFVPYDLASLDKALAGGHSLGEVAPDSPVRRALVPLAETYAGAGSNRSGRRRRHKGSGRRIA
jgi:Flp pilus assembly CpaE family ATPase